ncbi:putative membrane protein [Streptosporangium becharense]|uniref:Putative membrane protein n=1 Tax=Streptosporangium becharense TaxID=1816182 RepID=A0A7W9IJZ6_9ACTN|nr:SRPBCC family protein [Streptosporangium becharense]MBB2913114.1 putative membrane protein [Streptosporangium becharense]MBB5822097.1 putative membrane protein [Streptosporangium becharense]
MIELHVSAEIARPAAEIWQMVADFGQDPRWRAGVTTMAPDPPGLVVPGTTTDETLRFAGRTYLICGLVTSVVPGREFAWRSTSGLEVDGGRAVIPLGDDRCRVTMSLRIRLRGMRRLQAPRLRRMLRRKMRQDVIRLGELVITRS